MKECLGIINLDESEKRTTDLTRYRPLAALPIAGRYRVVDFILSNMTNSGIESIGIFAKNKSRSLMDHLSNGKPWDIYHKKDGLKVFNFGDTDPVYNDVDSFLDNLDYFQHCNKEYVLISSSYMVCNIDYKKVLKEHKESNNQITIVYKNVKNIEEKFLNCEVLNIDENNKVNSIGRNLSLKGSTNINMEMYIMKTDLFIDIIYECIKSGRYRKVKEYIADNVNTLSVGGYAFNGYLACINSIKSYFSANMDFLNEKVNKELFHSKSPIYTKPKDACPTQYTEDSEVVNSIIANGTYIEGVVKNSIIGRNVYIGKGSVIENCVIMQNTVIGQNVNMKQAVTDKGTIIKDEEEVKGLKDTPVIIPKKILKDSLMKYNKQ